MLNHLHATAQAPKRVVIIGAAGFVGGAIRAHLERRGVPVVAITRAEVDLLEPDAGEKLAARLDSNDAVVAAAALVPVKDLRMLRANLDLLQALRHAFERVPPAYLLNIGSDAVFADLAVPLREDSPRAPATLHGLMHTAREVVFADLPVPTATLRPTLIYGARDPHNGYGPNRFFRLAGAGKAIVLFGEGEERRDHVLIDDVAELATHLLFHRSVGSLNVATGTVWSFREVASMVVALFDSPVAIGTTPRQGPMPHNGYRPFDVTATSMAFPTFHYTPLPDGLKRVRRELSDAVRP